MTTTENADHEITQKHEAYDMTTMTIAFGVKSVSGQSRQP